MPAANKLDFMSRNMGKYNSILLQHNVRSPSLSKGKKDTLLLNKQAGALQISEMGLDCRDSFGLR